MYGEITEKVIFFPSFIRYNRENLPPKERGLTILVHFVRYNWVFFITKFVVTVFGCFRTTIKIVVMKNFSNQNLLYKITTVLVIIICLAMFLLLIYDICDKFMEKRTTTSVSYTNDKVSISTTSIYGAGSQN